MQGDPLDNSWLWRLNWSAEGNPTSLLDTIPLRFARKQGDVWGLSYDPFPHKNNVLASALATIDCSTPCDEPAKISDVQGAGGYRFLNARTPTISVPGVPDVWKNVKVGRVQTDDRLPGAREIKDFAGMTLIPFDISPLEPIFHSLISPTVLLDVDVITPSNILNKIHRLCGATSIYDEQDSFQFDAQLIGKTVILHRHNTVGDRGASSAKRVSAKSYHAAATEASTANANINAPTMRMTTYQFGGLKYLVPFNVDLCSKLPLETAMSENIMADLTSSTSSGDSRTSNSEPGATKLDPKVQRVTSPGMSGLTILHSGYEHPAHDTLIELKTRKFERPIDEHGIYAQLLFSQTPSLIVARHERNDYSYEKPKRYSLVGPELSEARAVAKPILQQVARVIREVVRITREQHTQHASVSFVKDGTSLVCIPQRGDLIELSGQAKTMLRRDGA